MFLICYEEEASNLASGHEHNHVIGAHFADLRGWKTQETAPG